MIVDICETVKGCNGSCRVKKQQQLAMNHAASPSLWGGSEFCYFFFQACQELNEDS